MSLKSSDPLKISYVWVDGGTEQVSALALTGYGSDRVSATFNVTKPTVNASASVETYANNVGCTGYYPDADGVNGINMFDGHFPYQTAAQGMVGFSGVTSPDTKNKDMVPGVTFTASPDNVDDEFQFAWVQVINKLSAVESLYVDDAAQADPTLANKHINGDTLDNCFPYNPLGTDYLKTYDGPRWLVSQNAMRLPTGTDYTISFNFSATMWYMCRPIDGGNWIPLAAASWGVQLLPWGSEREVPTPTRIGCFLGDPTPRMLSSRLRPAPTISRPGTPRHIILPESILSN